MAVILHPQQYLHVTLAPGFLGPPAYRLEFHVSPPTGAFNPGTVPGTVFPTDMLYEGPGVILVDIVAIMRVPDNSYINPGQWLPLNGKTVTPNVPSTECTFRWVNGTTVTAKAMALP